MPYDAEATRARIMEAACAEFAEQGIAGARVDRIAARAKANKASIYSYFGTKEQLFAAVLERRIGDLTEAVELTPDRVAEYAGELFDHYRENPQLPQLLRNEALYHGAGPVPLGEQRAAHYRTKTGTLQEGQATGQVTGVIPPNHLLMLLLGTVGWYFTVPQVARMLVGDHADPKVVAAWRASVVEAVRRIAAPSVS